MNNNRTDLFAEVFSMCVSSSLRVVVHALFFINIEVKETHWHLKLSCDIGVPLTLFKCLVCVVNYRTFTFFKDLGAGFNAFISIS